MRQPGQISTHRANWTPQWLRAARRRLGAWYSTNARDLPWRRTRDPYAVWISEIMLQQTQVATVVRYFPRFLQAFPDVAALAAASEDQVLRLWEGLGYYRRARQLHAAAKIIVARHAGRFPSDPAAVQQLPGIGRYTAGAILSIAFDASQPILEANTIRLLSRLLAFRGDPAGGPGRNLLWQASAALLPARGAGKFNQALMELGSRVCTPRDPLCGQCPLRSLCSTRRHGLQHLVPAPKKRPAVEKVREAAVVVVRNGAVLLRKCPDRERWAGLWDFPRFPLTTSNGQPVESELRANMRRSLGLSLARLQHFATLRHGVTRFRITLDAYFAQCRSRNGDTNGREKIRWVKPTALHDYPLSTTGRKIALLWQAQAGLRPRR